MGSARMSRTPALAMKAFLTEGGNGWWYLLADLRAERGRGSLVVAGAAMRWAVSA
jgi:hypothetical protein